MNKTLKLALSAVLGVALVSPALAQDNFPDVPQNHWAFQALSSLKDKVLFGYPDGFYRGSRFTSRYELAAALDKIWKAMMAQFDGVNAKINRLESMVGTGSDAGLQKQIDDLKNELNGMRSWRGDIDTLQRLTREFQSELQQLGVDVNEMKDQISDLDGRLTALENRKSVDVGVEANVLILAGHSSEGNFGLTQDGRVTGVGSGSYAGGPVGMDKDLNIYHDNYITLKGGKEGEPQFEGVLLVSNLFSDFGGLGGFAFGSGFDDSDDETIGLVKAAVTFNSELLGQGFHAQIGRVGHQVGRYLLKRPAYTEHYYDQEFRNNGDYIFDGGVLGFNFGGVDLTVFGGRNSDRNLLGSGGTDINPIPFGAGSIDRTLGVQVRFPIGDRGGASLAYLWQDSDSVIADANPYSAGLQPANRLNVYGADVDFTFSNIKFYGSFAQSVLSENTSNALDDNNTAWDVRLGYDSDRWGIVGGYRTVEANFFAAGDWGRIGTWYNPTNVQGWNASVYFKPSDSLKIYGKGEFLEGNDNALPGYLTEQDKVTSYTIGLEYRLNNMFDLGLKYENNDFDFDGGIPDPYQRWYTVMLGYSFNPSSKILFTYSYSDADGRGVGVPGMPGTGRFKGGLFGTQLKFSF